MKRHLFHGSFWLLLGLTIAGCFTDPGTTGHEGETETEGGSEGPTGGETETEGMETETGSETGDTGSTGDGDGDGDGDVPTDLPTEPSPEGEPCDPLDPGDPCVDDYTCSLYEWDGVGNYFEFVCLEYIGEPDGGGFGDQVGGWGECRTGFAPMNNFGLDNFPDGICPGAGNGGTCCTAICSADNPGCPSQMVCNLFLEPMNPELYVTGQYGTCIRE